MTETRNRYARGTKSVVMIALMVMVVIVTMTVSVLITMHMVVMIPMFMTAPMAMSVIVTMAVIAGIGRWSGRSRAGWSLWMNVVARATSANCTHQSTSSSLILNSSPAVICN